LKEEVAAEEEEDEGEGFGHGAKIGNFWDG
jgi:hypothetical protein